MVDYPIERKEYKGWAKPSIFAYTEGDFESRKNAFNKDRQAIIDECGLTVETLIIEICHFVGYPKIGVDQWWGFWVDGSIENYKEDDDPNDIELELKIFIQADDFMLGLIEMYNICKCFWEEHKQRKVDW